VRLTRRQALLAAMFPVVALSALNHFYKLPLYRLHPAWYRLGDAMQFVAAPLLAAWCLLRPAGIGLQDVGLGRDRAAGATLFTALLLVAGTWPVHVVANLYLSPYVDLEVALVQSAAAGHGAGRWLVLLYMAATAALVEEVFFRALPWLYVQDLALGYRRAVYVAATSLAFALVHSEQGPGGILAAGWFGFIAASLYGKSRKLWPLVLGHFLFDLVALAP